MPFEDCAAPKQNYMHGMNRITALTVRCVMWKAVGKASHYIQISLPADVLRQARYCIGDYMLLLCDRQARLCLLKRTPSAMVGRKLCSGTGKPDGTFETGHVRLKLKDDVFELFFPNGQTSFQPDYVAVKEEGILFSLPGAKV